MVVGGKILNKKTHLGIVDVLNYVNIPECADVKKSVWNIYCEYSAHLYFQTPIIEWLC